ncbi:hypothetical protein M427DRAFT_37359 [Gonapodya prolifera JEL478]|uniref:Uncharacterized protein n=1 Tax=Gonapodya prolifera (strain JEL478) TaxID=1344416 RepID=A0A139A110_GONPJ|nr:hypothetical protein M427DRAFT_37359 [Gonapodya prolifera JEL478]|eukprot:KXS10414.1 hypothetical protein M427DRAFT_37359 [Gonapodya prolifera JEL478]
MPLVILDAQWVFAAKACVALHKLAVSNALLDAGATNLQLDIDYWRQVEFGSFNIWAYFAQTLPIRVFRDFSGFTSSAVNVFLTKNHSGSYANRALGIIEALSLPISQLSGSATASVKTASLAPLTFVGLLKSRLRHEVRARRKALEVLKASRQEYLGVLAARGLLSLNSVVKGQSPADELVGIEASTFGGATSFVPQRPPETSTQGIRSRINVLQR